MQPKFRSDLTCSREEQTGGVFYRIFDEKTQTSFRLYEIEYIIATKLDGERETPAVIQAVKEDFNFDITEPDLQRFVGQLESMGFLEETAAAPTPQSTVPELPPEMGSLDFSEVNPVESPDVQMAAEPVAAAPEIDLLATEETSDAALVVNQAEYERLLKVALMSIWQGYLSTARDYFLAARELDSSDSRISEIIEHLVVIGDAGGADEASYLWKQVSELYPRQVAELEASAKGEMQGEEERAIDHDTGDGWGDEPHAETDLRSRVVWTLALLFLMVGGGAGIYFFVTETGLLESEPLVRVQTLKSITVPMPYPQAATEITPEKEEWLHFGADGKIKELLVVKGQKVKSGDKIASLVLPPKSRKALAQAQRALKKAEKSYAPVAAKLAVLLKKREALESQSVDVEEKLRELQPEGVLRQGGNSKRQLAKLKKKKVGLDKKLKMLSKKERKPRAVEKKVKVKLDAALLKLKGIETKLAPSMLSASFSGTVIELRVKAKGAVAKGKDAIMLRDESAIRLTFHLEGNLDFKTGGEVHIVVAGADAVKAKVVDLAEKGKTSTVVVRLPDPLASYSIKDPKEFSLIRSFVTDGYEIPTSALIKTDDDTFYVMTAANGLVQRRTVQVLKDQGISTLIRQIEGKLHDGQKVVVQRSDDLAMDDIRDDSSVKIDAKIDSKE